MFVESIKFQREQGSEWERGYYIGRTDNSKESILLDSHYNPIFKNGESCGVWDYGVDTDNWIQLRCNENDD